MQALSRYHFNDAPDPCMVRSWLRYYFGDQKQ